MLLKHLRDGIFTFGKKNRSYYVTKSKHGAGASGDSRNRYDLTRVTTPPYMTIRIKITIDNIGVLAMLDNAARIALCDKLIADQLCQECLEQKSREPPQWHNP